MSIVPNLDEMTDEQKLAVLESVQKSIAESKEIQKRKIGENVELVVQALKKIESDIRDRFDGVGNAIEKRVASIKDGRDGANGKDGRDGKDGRPGKDGLKGDRGVDGQAGRDGVDGVDGVSVINANIDFDGSLIISLSDGREINVGEVVSADVAEKIKVISTMSTNGAIVVKEEGTTITNGVKSLNFVGAGITATTSGDDVTVTVAGGGGSGTVTSVAALTLGTSGTDLSSTVATSTTTPVITLNVPTASATNRGALSSADWTTFNNKGSGTVTSVTGTSPVVSSGGATPAISLASGYGDTLNPYASKTANFVLAAPNGSAGAPTFRAIVAADIPTLNQNTTGTAAGLSATLVATSGGTGQSSYAVGDLLYASTTTALSKLADVATGNALISGGVGVAPSWGKVGLATHVSGTLPTANGGTNLTSFTSGGVVYASSTSALTTGSALVFDGTNLGVGGTTNSYGSQTTLTLSGANVSRIDFRSNSIFTGTILSYQAVTEGLRLQTEAGYPITFYPAGAIAATFTTGGNLQLQKNMSVGNATPTTSGAGITFPATQSASSDANTLDDYEEGSWTPALTGTTAVSYANQVGRYTKIGRLVTIQFVLQTNSQTYTSTGATFAISGLPFAGTFPGYTAGDGVANLYSITFTGYVLCSVNSSSLNLTQIQSATAFSSLTNAAALPGFIISGTISYITT